MRNRKKGGKEKRKGKSGKIRKKGGQKGEERKTRGKTNKTGGERKEGIHCTKIYMGHESKKQHKQRVTQGNKKGNQNRKQDDERLRPLQKT